MFATALWSSDVAPGTGMGGDVAAAAYEFRPAHAPGHAVQLGLAKAATLLPAGSIAFRVRVLSALFLGLAAALIASAALRLIRAIAGPGGPAHAAAAAAIGVVAGWTAPVLACAASADVFALQAALGAAVLWACTGAAVCGSAAIGEATGRLVVGAFAAGLAAVNHLPSGLPLAPPLILAGALTLARTPRGAAVAGESLLAGRISWIVAGFAVGLVAVFALPLRSADLSDPGLLLRTVLSRTAVSAMDADAAPAGWLPGGGTSGVLLGAMGPVALVVAGVALVAMAFVRSARSAAIGILGFVVGPAAIRAGLVIDRGPAEVAAYLAVPAMAVALAFAAPAGLAIGLARGDASWRRRVGWGAVLVLLFAALVRQEARSIDPARDRARGRASLLAADALAEPPPPGAAVFISRSAAAALVAHDQTVFGRRPDLALLLVPRLPEAGYARERIADEPDLAPLISAYLGPASSSTTALSTAAERLASRRPLFAEPGRLTAPIAPRSLLPHGPLLEILPQAMGRTELAAALAAGRREPTRLDRRAAGLAGTSLGTAMAWNLANAAVLAARIGVSITSQPGDPSDARGRMLSEAVRLAREALEVGAPAAPVERLLEVLSVVPGPDAARLEGILER